MSNRLRVPNTDSCVTWRKGTVSNTGDEALDFVVRNKKGEPIAKAKITAEQLHAYVCTHNTMK